VLSAIDKANEKRQQRCILEFRVPSALAISPKTHENKGGKNSRTEKKFQTKKKRIGKKFIKK
jgi:hypothetical protein